MRSRGLGRAGLSGCSSKLLLLSGEVVLGRLFSIAMECHGVVDLARLRTPFDLVVETSGRLVPPGQSHAASGLRSFQMVAEQGATMRASMLVQIKPLLPKWCPFQGWKEWTRESEGATRTRIHASVRTTITTRVSSKVCFSGTSTTP